MTLHWRNGFVLVAAFLFSLILLSCGDDDDDSSDDDAATPDDDVDDDDADDDQSDDDTVDDDTADDDTADDDTTDDDDLDDDTFVDPCEGVEQVYDPVGPWEEDGVTFRELIPPCVGCDGLSIAVNAEDQPVIAATRGSYLMLYPRTSECGWTREAVARHGIDPILKADGAGFLHLLFYDEGESALRYGTNETGVFAFETVPWPEELDPTDGIVFDMALDADGFAHMAMAQSLWSGPVLTTCNRTDSWIDRIVDTDIFSSADSIAIAVGPDGYEHVAVDYWTMWGPGTNVWSETAQGFPPENESDGFDTFFPDLAVDSESNPSMVTNGDEILYWEKVGGVWTDVLFNFGLCWSNSMLAVDEFDVVHVGFCPYSLFPYIRYDNGDLTGIAYLVDEFPNQTSLTAKNGIAHMVFGSDKHLVYLTPTENMRHLRSQPLDSGNGFLVDPHGVQSSDGTFHFCATESGIGKRIHYGTIGNDDSTSMTVIENLNSSEFETVGRCAIALDKNHEPHIFVGVEPGDNPTAINLYHLWREADDWRLELVDEDIHWLERPAAVDFNDGFHVFYRKNGRLWEAAEGDDGWTTNGLGYQMYFFVDAVVNKITGEIFVAFDSGDQYEEHGVFARINVLKSDGVNWEPIAGEEYGRVPVLAVDDRGRLHMIYADSTLSYPSAALYRRYWDGAWTETETVGVGMSNLAMAIDGDRKIVIHGGNGDFTISVKTTGDWSDAATVSSPGVFNFWRSTVFLMSDNRVGSVASFDEALLDLSVPIE